MTTKKEENLLLCKGTLMMTFKQRISKSVYLTFFLCFCRTYGYQRN